MREKDPDDLTLMKKLREEQWKVSLLLPKVISKLRLITLTTLFSRGYATIPYRLFIRISLYGV